MKFILPFVLTTLLMLRLLSTIAVSNQTRLTNSDIGEMTKSELAEGIILARIKGSPTNLYASPTTLQ